MFPQRPREPLDGAARRRSRREREQNDCSATLLTPQISLAVGAGFVVQFNRFVLSAAAPLSSIHRHGAHLPRPCDAPGAQTCAVAGTPRWKNGWDMALNLDLSAAIRHPDLGRLVQAVVGAGDNDEADWIEWKSTLDLTTKGGCFHIARTVLGMANRLPESASLTCEGLGYIVIGAEPKTVTGITGTDPAHLDQTLEPWLGGAEGPRYTPTYLTFDGKTVLVVTVEAPKNGDPPYALRKEFNNARDGDLFVRKQGRTVRATSADQKALYDRLTAAPKIDAKLEVSLVGDVPLSWFDRSKVDDVIDTYVYSRRKNMEANASAEERRRNPPPLPKAGTTKTLSVTGVGNAMAELARQQAHMQDIARTARLGALSVFGGEKDDRTFDEYMEQVENWAKRTTEAAPGALGVRYVDAGHGLVRPRVYNPTGHFLPAVKVEIHFEYDTLGHAEPEYDEGHLPGSPRPFGEPKPSPILSPMLRPDLHYTMPSMPKVPIAPRSWIEDGSVKIVFDVGDLRQESSDIGDDHYLLLAERPADGVLHGTWKATIPDVHGVINGMIDVPVKEEPVDMLDLLENKPEPDYDDD